MKSSVEGARLHEIFISAIMPKNSGMYFISVFLRSTSAFMLRRALAPIAWNALFNHPIDRYGPHKIC